MIEDDDSLRWQQILALLAPFHEAAARTARRLGRSTDDGDDLLSETILRAFDKFHTLRDPARFRSWFFAVLLSVHRNRARRQFWKRFLSLEARQEDGFDPVGADGAREADQERKSERAARALATLNPEQREAIVLFELEGFSIEEIAAMSGAGISAVKSRLARGRTRLAQCYERWESHVATSRTEHDVSKPAIKRARLVAD